MVLSDSASTVFFHVAFIAHSPSYSFAALSRHATELGKHVWIVSLIPVAKARSQQLRCRRPRGALENKMFSVKKIFRVVGINLHIRTETRKRSKGCIGQLPAVSHQFRYTPSAIPHGTRAHGQWRPRDEIEITVPPRRGRFSPWVSRLFSVRPVKRRAVKLRFSRQTFATPRRVSSCLRQADVHRPTANLIEGNDVEHPSI